MDLESPTKLDANAQPPSKMTALLQRGCSATY